MKEEKVTQADEETRRRAERARQVGLFRYRLVQRGGRAAAVGS